MTKLQINEEMQNQYPHLTSLILNSYSLSDQDKQHILDMIPTLETNQLIRLIEIFEDEKQKMEELEKKYSDTLEFLKL